MKIPSDHPAFDPKRRHRAFFSARTKLGRAGAMIEAFEEMVNDLIKQQPSQLVQEEIKPGICRIKIVTKPTPTAVPLFLGEILHNLRGALDHLASSVVEHSNQKPNVRINFPVHEAKDQFETMRTRPKPHQLASAAPDVWQIIEETVQPWKDNEVGNLIWAVSKLNNIDKHRLLLIIPFRSFAPINGGNRGGQFRNCLFIMEGWGEVNYYEGPRIHLQNKKIYPEMYLREESVLPKQPILPFLKEAYNQVFGLIYALETHMFGDNQVIEGT